MQQNDQRLIKSSENGKKLRVMSALKDQRFALHLCVTQSRAVMQYV